MNPGWDPSLELINFLEPQVPPWSPRLLQQAGGEDLSLFENCFPFLESGTSVESLLQLTGGFVYSMSGTSLLLPRGFPLLSQQTGGEAFSYFADPLPFMESGSSVVAGIPVGTPELEARQIPEQSFKHRLRRYDMQRSSQRVRAVVEFKARARESFGDQFDTKWAEFQAIVTKYKDRIEEAIPEFQEIFMDHPDLLDGLIPFLGEKSVQS